MLSPSAPAPAFAVPSPTSSSSSYRVAATKRVRRGFSAINSSSSSSRSLSSDRRRQRLSVGGSRATGFALGRWCFSCVPACWTTIIYILVRYSLRYADPAWFYHVSPYVCSMYSSTRTTHTHLLLLCFCPAVSSSYSSSSSTACDVTPTSHTHPSLSLSLIFPGGLLLYISYTPSCCRRKTCPSR